MKNKALIIATGFALFSMFFGSGNLVFPITVGRESEGHYLLASFGILFTGVIVPFLGTLGIALYGGSLTQFFSPFGKKGTFAFSLFALSLLGPFGVVARCLTVAHGSLLPLFPEASLKITSLILCGVIFIFTINRGKIIDTLGKYLTPLLLLTITLIVCFALRQGSIAPGVSSNSLNALKNGLFQGYQTMDLLAAFFFSQFVIQHLRSKLTHENQDSLMPVFLRAAGIGSILLCGIYFALVLLGWKYAPLLEGIPPQNLLGTIAEASLGKIAAPCVCLAVFFACLTTAIALAALFSDFVKTQITKEYLGEKTILVLTLCISWFVSTFDFAGIARFLGPILTVVYPLLIGFTLFNIGKRYIRIRA